MNKLTLLVLLAGLMPALTYAEKSTVYTPRIKNNGLDELESAKVQRGMFGAAFTNTLNEASETQPGFMFSGRYFAGDHLYVLTEIQLSSFNLSEVVVDGEVIRESREEAMRYGFGAGFSFLQGNASTSGQYVIPWVMAAEVFAGEQYTGDTSGQYTSLGLSIQFHGKRVWSALGARQFSIADERLKSLGSDGGMQWDISLGMWF